MKIKITAIVIGFLYAGFLGIFAFDSPLGLGTLIHLIPSLLVIVTCLIAIQNVIAGEVCMLILAVASTLFFPEGMKGIIPV